MFGPQDHTSIGGVNGEFNDDPEPSEMDAPVTRNSPWKVNFPGWRTVILGSSGGVHCGLD